MPKPRKASVFGWLCIGLMVPVSATYLCFLGWHGLERLGPDGYPRGVYSSGQVVLVVLVLAALAMVAICLEMRGLGLRQWSAAADQTYCAGQICREAVSYLR